MNHCPPSGKYILGPIESLSRWASIRNHKSIFLEFSNWKIPISGARDSLRLLDQKGHSPNIRRGTSREIDSQIRRLLGRGNSDQAENVANFSSSSVSARVGLNFSLRKASTRDSRWMPDMKLRTNQARFCSILFRKPSGSWANAAHLQVEPQADECGQITYIFVFARLHQNSQTHRRTGITTLSIRRYTVYINGTLCGRPLSLFKKKDVINENLTSSQTRDIRKKTSGK